MTGRPLSLDLRLRILAWVEAGQSRRATAAKVDISPGFVVGLMRRCREAGPFEPARQGRPPGGGPTPLQAFVIDLLEARPDITMPELAEVAKAEHGISADPSRFSRCLTTLGFSYVRSRIATERGCGAKATSGPNCANHGCAISATGRSLRIHRDYDQADPAAVARPAARGSVPTRPSAIGAAEPSLPASAATR